MKKIVLFICFSILSTIEILSQNTIIPFSTEINGKKLYGYKDEKTGKEVIAPKYTSCYWFTYDDYNKVEIEGKFGILHKSGKEISQIKYDDVSPNLNDGLFAVNLNGKYGYVDLNGKEVIPLTYSYAHDFNSGRAHVLLNEKDYFIDTKGKIIIDLNQLNFKTNSSFFEGFCKVEQEINQITKYGYIDVNGKVLDTLKYDMVEDFSNGIGLVNIGGKYEWDGYQGIDFIGGNWGYINSSGKEVTPLKYSAAKSFSDRLAAVELDGKWGFIDTSGNVVIPLVYSFVNRQFFEGVAEVYLDDKMIKIDKTGNEVIDK